MTTGRERRMVFGEAVELYEAARHDHPDAPVSDVAAAAGPGPALEVGAGTGKATVAFAAHGLDLTCLEPDPRMAAALRRTVAAYPGVRVVDSTFESWRPDRAFGLLYSAQAWHWVDEEVRTDLAAAALAPGGTLALFWNASLVADPELHAALADVDAEFLMNHERTPHGRPATAHPPEISDDFAAEWPTLGLVADDRFTDLRSRR